MAGLDDSSTGKGDFCGDGELSGEADFLGEGLFLALFALFLGDALGDVFTFFFFFDGVASSSDADFFFFFASGVSLGFGELLPLFFFGIGDFSADGDDFGLGVG